MDQTLRVHRIDMVRLHADLMMLARRGQALVRTRDLAVTAEKVGGPGVRTGPPVRGKEGANLGVEPMSHVRGGTMIGVLRLRLHSWPRQ
jgi:hypothetical protein